MTQLYTEDNILPTIPDGYHRPIEYENLHETNKQHLDFGRTIKNARKMQSAIRRMNLDEFKNLSETQRLTTVNKKSIWTATWQELKDNGFSPFGAYFYRTFKNGISKLPMASLDTIMKVSDDPILNKNVMTAIYLYGNNKIIEAFEETPISEVTDCLVFLHNLDLSIPKTLYGETIQMIDKYLAAGDDEYFDYDILAKENLVNSKSKDRHELKRVILDLFPDHVEELKQHTDFHYSQLLGMQLGKPLRNYLRDIVTVIKKAQKQAELHGWNRLLKEDEPTEEPDNTKMQSGALQLIHELELLNKTRIRLIGRGADTIGNLTQNNHELHNKHLHVVERTGYDWNNSQEIHADTLKDKFNISGVQWGASVNGKFEREEWLKLISESLSDLAFALNADTKAIGLHDGDYTLAIAVGSQGQTNAQAHYGANEHFIHLNRMRSSGSLAHEWFHAYDKMMFNKVVTYKENVFPKDVMDSALQKQQYFYTTLLRDFFRNIDKYSDEQRKKVEEFDEYLFHVGKILWEKHEVFAHKNHDETIDYVHNFVNYDDSDRIIANFEQIIDNSIEMYKTMSQNIEHLLSYESMDDSSKMTQSILRVNHFYLKMIAPQYRDALIDENNQFTSQKLKDNPQLREELFENLTDFVKNYREKILNSKTIKEIREPIGEIFVQQDQKLFDVLSNNIQDAIEREFHTLKNTAGFVADNTIKTNNISANVNRSISQERKEAIKNAIKETSEQIYQHINNIDPILAERVKTHLARHEDTMERGYTDLLANRITQQVHIKALENNYRFSLGNRYSFYYQNSLLADNTSPIYDNTHYYATPHEMFARLGEYSVNKILDKHNMSNLFLTNTLERQRREIAMGFRPVYPMGTEAEILSISLVQSVQLQLGSFKESLDNIPIIQHEYNSEVTVDIEPEETLENQQNQQNITQQSENKITM